MERIEIIASLERSFKNSPRVPGALSLWSQFWRGWVQGRLWKTWVDLSARQAEPRVWQQRDRAGKLYWRVYDPSTGQSTACSSEQEVRAWLEQRYYR